MRTSETLLRRRHYDVVHSQGLASRRASVITAHICNEARRRQPGHSFKTRAFAAVAARLERNFYASNRNAQVIAVSAVVASELVALSGVVTEPSVIYHGVDCGQFTPASLEERSAARRRFGLRADAWVWLFVGEAVKGLEGVIRQLVSFREAFLLVVTRSKTSDYERLARACGVMDRVKFHGPEPLMREAYHAADVLVYPSSYDAFGMVVAEAMASGLPVVAGRNIGAAEWIEHGHNGLLCDAGDDASVRGAITVLAEDKSRGGAMGLAARKTALQHTWNDCARRTLELYENTMIKPHPER